jgi:hypothetical protein
MAVGFLASSESHTGTTGSTNQSTFSWSHAPGGTARGVLVFVYSNIDATEMATDVTYGGVALAKITEQVNGSAEPGTISLWYLGSSIPTGTQTVVVTRVTNAVVMYATAATVSALADTEVYTNGVLGEQSIGTLVEQNVTDGSPGTNSVRFAGVLSGLASPPPAGANSTLLQSIDYGQRGNSFVRETAAGQGSRPVGFSGASDDKCALYAAVREAGNNKSGSASVSVSVTATASIRKEAQGAGSTTATAALTASIRKGGLGTASTPITVTASATGGQAENHSGSASVSITVTATGAVRKGGRGPASTTATAAATATGRKGALGLASTSAVATLTAAVRKGARAVASTSAGVSLVAAGRKGARGLSSTAAGAALTAAVRKGALGLASLPTTVTVTATGERPTQGGAASVTVTVSLTASGRKGAQGAAASAPTTTWTATVSTGRRGVASVLATAILTALGGQPAPFSTKLHVMTTHEVEQLKASADSAAALLRVYTTHDLEYLTISK